jgi:hypothetical protein
VLHHIGHEPYEAGIELQTIEPYDCLQLGVIVGDGKESAYVYRSAHTFHDTGFRGTEGEDYEPYVEEAAQEFAVEATEETPIEEAAQEFAAEEGGDGAADDELTERVDEHSEPAVESYAGREALGSSVDLAALYGI